MHISIFICMKNLCSLREFIRNCLLEGIIKIPEFDDIEDAEKMLQLGGYSINEIYEEIQNFLKKKGGIEKIPPSGKDMLIMLNAFTIKNYNGDEVSIEISGYKAEPNTQRHSSDAIYLAPNTITFNLERFKNLSPSSFREVLFHELVHVKDPYLQKSKKYLSGDIDRSVSSIADPHEKWKAYAALQEEYTAQMSTYVNVFNSWIKKKPETFGLVYKLITKIINSKNIEELEFELIYDEEEFSEIFGDQSKYWAWLYQFFHWAKSWIVKPKMKNKFLKDFYKSFEPLLAKKRKIANLPDRKLKLTK